MSSRDEGGGSGREGGWPLRGQLMASHVGLIGLIVLGFGISIFVIMWRSIHRQAESDLLAAAQMLARELGGGRAGGSPEIPEAYQHRFGRAPRDRAYFAAWDAEGDRIAVAGPLPRDVAPLPMPPPSDGPHPFFAYPHRGRLEVIVAVPGGGQLLIGRPLAKEFDAIRRLLAELAAIGLGCLLAGAAGAWWLAGRIARPIVEIADAAGTITSRDLSRRIAVGRAPREVSRLAGLFNAMLDGLRESFERQVRFTGDASHELRTPVAVVLSQAEYTLSRERGPEDYREALRTCLQAARRMKSLVDDLLLLARADSGRLDLRREALDLAVVARQAVEMLQPLARERDVRLEMHLEPAPALGDAARLGRVVTNLVTNAVQYNVPGGDVAVTVRPGRGTAILVVRDRGPGIPLEDQPRLFDRFYRADRARTLDDGAGTGLGLSLVAEIVAAHGGTVRVESGPGPGTAMTVEIPAPAGEAGGGGGDLP